MTGKSAEKHCSMLMCCIKLELTQASFHGGKLNITLAEVLVNSSTGSPCIKYLVLFNSILKFGNALG